MRLRVEEANAAAEYERCRVAKQLLERSGVQNGVCSDNFRQSVGNDKLVVLNKQGFGADSYHLIGILSVTLSWGRGLFGFAMAGGTTRVSRRNFMAYSRENLPGAFDLQKEW